MTTTIAPEATARERLHIIQNHRSVAMVGVSANAIRSSNFVASYLVRTPFRTYPVNPAYDLVLGEKCYPSLADLPEVPDIVDIFRRPEAIPAVVEEAIDIGAKVVVVPARTASRRSSPPGRGGGPQGRTEPVSENRARPFLGKAAPRWFRHRNHLVEEAPTHLIPGARCVCWRRLRRTCPAGRGAKMSTGESESSDSMTASATTYAM